MNDPDLLARLFPEQGIALLSGTGRQLVERIGVDPVREIVLRVMMGENVRDHTEPLTRKRLSLVSAALMVMFLRGWLEDPGLSERISGMATQLLSKQKKDTPKHELLLSQWILGLTQKQVQNVLRDDSTRLERYAADLDQALEEAAIQCDQDYGRLWAAVGVATEDTGALAEVNWRDVLRLTTAIGSETLAIRGSDKSMFGKLFEKLVLGATLSVLGFRRVDRQTQDSDRVFWLSDSSASRESDATAIYRAGKVARFDIGFIGPGNPEISKDKLSRFERELEAAGGTHSSVTVILIDRLPAKSKKTLDAAKRLDAEIVQMHWQYWPRALAARLGERLVPNCES